MFRFSAIALLTAAAFAQNVPAAAEKPPAGVDEALRARIQEFYHYFETEEYRKAEKLVAEDSQDFFYNHNKPHYLSVEIQSIKYLDHFTRASVLALCEQYIMFPGFAGKPMEVPTPSTWKLVDGQWFWYVEPEDAHRTPFGVMKETSPRGAASPGLPASIPTTADFIMHQVKMETQSVTLKKGESVQVAIANTAKGPMNLVVENSPAGVEATLDRPLLGSGEKGVLTVRATDNAKSGNIEVRVRQTLEVLPLAVKIQVQ